MSDVQFGYERSRIGSHAPVRWWVYIHVDGEQARPQEPRRGVVDPGFRFARGGLAPDEDSARDEMRQAREQANREWRHWQGQPSHLLGPGGRLIPLGDVIPEIERGAG